MIYKILIMIRILIWRNLNSDEDSHPVGVVVILIMIGNTYYHIRGM